MKTMLYLLTTLLIISLTQATTWTQYTPSPVANSITRILSLNSGYAFGYTTAAANFILYNKTQWEEISLPTASTLNDTTTFLGADKINNGLIIIAYYNTTTKLRIFSYSPTSRTYTSIINTTKTATINEFECEENNNKCYIHYGNYNISQVYPTNSDLINTPSTTNVIKPSNKRLFTKFTGTNNGAIWNGISWNTYALSSATGIKFLEQDNNHKVLISTSAGLVFYNITAGTFHAQAKPITSLDTGTQLDSDEFFVTNDTKILRCNWNDETCTPLVTGIGQQINSMDYDESSGMGWAGGNNGIIYLYNESLAASGNYSVVLSAEFNPAIYGTDTKIYTTPSSALGEQSDITVDIYYNDTATMSMYQWTITNVPSGYASYNLIDSVAWTNFEIDHTYWIEAIATEDTTARTATANLYWTVNQTLNETIIDYNGTEYNWTNNYNLTGILSIDDYGSVIYASGYNSTTPTIFSIDATNFNNFQNNYYPIPATNRTSGLNTLTSTQTYLERLLIGTNNELFTYNTTQSGNVEDLIFLDNTGITGLYNDYIKDVAQISDDLAWLCNKGLSADGLYLYNYTSGTIDDYQAITPCISLTYDPTNDTLFIFKGANGISLYNNTDKSLIRNIDVTTAVSGIVTQDSIDYSGNIVFFIGNYNSIYQYDLTTDTYNRCVSITGGIISMEAINENEVIIGTENGGIEICDFANNDTYNSELRIYEAQSIGNLENPERAYEILLFNNDKISIATGTDVKFFTYQKTNETTTLNHKPQIISVTLSNSTPCIGQAVNVVVTAQDVDDDLLRYDYSCQDPYPVPRHMGETYNSFPCIYDSVGTKSITIYALDGYESEHGYEVGTKSLVVYNCTYTGYDIEILVKDCETDLTPLEGVQIILNGTIATTDDTGHVYYSVSANQNYPFTMSKAGYFPKSEATYPGITHHSCLSKMSTSTSGIIVYVENQSGTRLNGSFISIHDDLTGQNEIGFADNNGTAYFFNLFTSEKMLVSAKNEELGYLQAGTYISLSPGELKYVTITLSYARKGGAWALTNRSCIDPVSVTENMLVGTKYQDVLVGIWLCGNLSNNDNGSRCSSDANCVGDHCMIYPGMTDGSCSNFNYNYCDYKHWSREQQCIWLGTLYGVFDMAERSIFGGGKILLYLLIFIIFIGIIVFMRRKK
jgi:hypothetical protein